MVIHWFRRAAVAVMGVALATGALAQDYPSKPIRLVVPVAASGMTDIVARILGQKLSERLGQPVIIENKAGAGGSIGTEAVARADADGHTLLFAYPGPLVVNPSLFRNLSYDPVRDFAPISLVASYPMVLAVNPKVPANTVAELIALAKRDPKALTYGSAGNATTSHLAMELFRREAGIQMLHIPYKGAAPAMTDLIAGQLSAVVDSLTLVMPQVQAGKVRALAVTSKERSRAFPNLPSVAESGLKDFDVIGWYGILAPANTPKPIVDRLTREFTAVVRDPQVNKELVSRGLEPLGKDAAAFGQLIRTERTTWHRVVTEAGIKAD